MVLRHQLNVLRRQVPRPRLEPADRALLAAISRVLPRSRWSCFLVKPETLLRWHRRMVAGSWTFPRRGHGRPPLDDDFQQLIVRLAQEIRAGATSASKASCSGWASRSRPPPSAPPCAATGLIPRRDGRARRGGVPAPAGRRDRGLRLLHRRYGVATPAVRTVLHRARHPPGPPGRGNVQPRWCLGRPAGTEPAAGAWRGGPAGTLRAARPGCQVLPQLRCSVPGGGRRDAPDPSEGAQGERGRRALGANRPRRVPGLAADRRPRPPRAGPSGLRHALQHPAPGARLAIVGDDQPARVHRRDLLGGLLHEYRRAA
jgi:hypothetical protein